MTERTDRKVESVVLAQFHYRHEAEFAAGFLDDAGIPYRLQVDDAGMGMTISTPATLWVRGMDLRAARDVLDLPERPGSLPDNPPAATSLPVPEPDPATRDITGAAVAKREPAETVTRTDSSFETVSPPGGPSARSPGPVSASRLTEFERLLAFVFLVADLGAVGLVQAVQYGPLWTGLLAVVGSPLAMAALTGRTIGPVRKLLRAMSGSAP